MKQFFSFFHKSPQWSADIPIAQDAPSRFVPWVIAPLVFLLCLVTAGTFSLNYSLFRWNASTQGKVTLEVPLHADQDRQKTLSTIVTFMKKTPGISSIVPLNTDRLLGILEPWVGHPDVLRDLPLPLLFDIETDSRTPVKWTDVTATLRHISAGARLEFHSQWQDTLSLLRSSFQLIAYLFAALIGVAVLVTIMLVTKAGLDAHLGTIQTLRLLGASPTYIAQEFQWHVLRVAAKGSMVGMSLALPLIFLVNWASSGLRIPEIVRPEVTGKLMVALVGVPIFIILLSALVGRLCVAYTLARQ